MVTRSNIFSFVFMVMLSVTPFLATEIPRFLSFWPCLIGLIMSFWWVKIEKGTYRFSKNYLIVTGSLSALCLLSALWSINPAGTLGEASKASLIMLSGVFLFSLCQSLNPQELKKHAYLFVLGVIAAGALSFSELYNDMPVYKIIRDYDFAYKANPSSMNRGIVFMVFSSFAALYFIRYIKPRRTQILMSLALILSIFAALFMTESQSAQLAMILGMAILLFFPVRYKPAFNILALVIIALMCLTPFIVSFLFDLLIGTGQSIPWLKTAYAGNRVEVWEFVLRFAMHNPIYGYGMEATQFIDDFHTFKIHHQSDTVLHPHNFSLQFWIEFGAIGILITGALFALLLGQMKTLPVIARRFSLAAFISILSVAGMGYGIWQSWWIGGLIFITALCALIANFVSECKKPQKA